MNYEEIMEKYGDLSEEEVEELPEEEKVKIYAAIEEMKVEGKKQAEEFKKEFDAMPEEKKAEMRANVKKGMEMAQKMASWSNEERLASMLNPETEDFTEDELKLAKDLCNKYPDKIPEEIIGLEMEEEIKKYAEERAKRGILNTIKRFIKRLFNG